MDFSKLRELRTAWYIVVLLGIVFLGGGSSRADAWSQPVIRVAAIMLAAISLIRPRWIRARSLLVPVVLLSLTALIMIVQVIPLPPAVWTTLPGRALFIEVASMLAQPQPWRPVSINPDLTYNSALSLLLPFSMFILLAQSTDRQLKLVANVILCGAIASAFIGLIQLANPDAWINIFSASDPGTSTGLFANRNHHALLCAMMIPLITTLLVHMAGTPPFKLQLLGTFGAIFFALCALLTGSRSGLASLLLAVLGSGLIVFFDLLKRQSGTFAYTGQNLKTRFGTPKLLMILAVPVVIASTVLVARQSALGRLFDQDVSQDRRIALLQPMLEVAYKYWPVGSGFGSFVAAFRIDEPFTNLTDTYMNQAHNDWLQFAMEGGLPAAMILLSFVVWTVVSGARVWLAPVAASTAAMARLGFLWLAMLGLASVSDYPLRTPIMMAVACVAIVMLSSSFKNSNRQPQ